MALLLKETLMTQCFLANIVIDLVFSHQLFSQGKKSASQIICKVLNTPLGATEKKILLYFFSMETIQQIHGNGMKKRIPLKILIILLLPPPLLLNKQQLIMEILLTPLWSRFATILLQIFNKNSLLYDLIIKLLQTHK